MIATPDIYATDLSEVLRRIRESLIGLREEANIANAQRLDYERKWSELNDAVTRLEDAEARIGAAVSALGRAG